MAAINRGAFAYVEKVGNVEELLAHVHRAFHLHLIGYSEALERDVQKRHQELMRANLALRESEERFRNLIEGSLQGILIHRDNRALFVNRAYANIFGYETPDDILRMDSLSALIAPSEQNRLLRFRDARLAGQNVPTHYEYKGVRRDGSLVWLDMQVRVVSWKGAPATQSTVVDITGHKQAEDERQRLESQLRQSQKMEAVGTLAGGIAHDFNNVLGAILMHTELAQTLIPPDNPIQDNLQDVLLAAGRAKDLVKQILTFSRQVETQRQPVRLTSVIQDTLMLLRASLPTTIEIRYHLPDTEEAIFADPTQLHQIVLNLCVNAEHAMRETGGALDIDLNGIDMDDVFARSHPELLPGRHARLQIRDSGHGMTPEVMERIFDPFFTTKDVGDGTGMGLAMVHGMVASHGGAITVESTPGIGTTFTLYFPCIRESVGERLPSQNAIPHGAGCIMFVDDEPMLANSMKTLLTQLGYEVFPYTSSPEALAAFSSQPERFDLVITDQTMPQMTGEQLARELRRMRPDIPIILCTGFSHVINANKAGQQGIDAFCMKPMNMQELSATLHRVLAQRC